jgi:protein-L-isoaspartate(D-aspartate) O-methyltransferase
MVTRQLRKRGLSSERVLAAMRHVPRHEFVPSESRVDAYADFPLQIGDRQTISQPYIVALMTEILDVDQGHRVLEIGTGSGYQTAVLAELAREVYTVEIREPLLQSARERLSRLRYTGINIRLGDGSEGWSDFAPFDRIIVTACSEELPVRLADQIAPGWRMVLPVGGPDGDQKLLTVVRRPDLGMDIEEGVPVRFVMMTS